MRTRRQGLIAYAVWFALGYLILVATGLVSYTQVAFAVIVPSLSKDLIDHRRGFPGGPWYLDHFPFVAIILYYAVFSIGYGQWNPFIIAAASVCAAVDLSQDWFRFTK